MLILDSAPFMPAEDLTKGCHLSIIFQQIFDTRDAAVEILTGRQGRALKHDGIRQAD
jgi:hypothetical protein